MFYYETDERKGKVIGGIAGVLYILFWVVLMFIVSFNFERPDTGEGILINFGNVEFASGLNDPDENDMTVESNVHPAEAATDPDEVITQNREDAPEIVREEKKPEKKPETQPKPEQKKPEETPPQEPQRTVNRQALFPGRTQGSNSASEGTEATGAGNQGVLEGSPQGSHDGTGVGAGGTGFDLKGRSVVGTLPQPDYGANKQGRVIVEITVDAAGVVTNASYRARGSTTNDSDLVNAALKAARKSRFNKIEGDGLQTGTITYNFKLK